MLISDVHVGTWAVLCNIKNNFDEEIGLLNPSQGKLGSGDALGAIIEG